MVAVEAIVRGVHSLSAAIWVGGLTLLLLVVLPAFSQRGDAALLMDLQKRMVRLIRPVIAVVVISGLLLMRNALVDGGGGMARPYLVILIVKLVLTALMIVVAVRRQWWLHKYAYSRPRRGFILLVVNTALGWLTIILSGVLTVVGDAVM
jgi:putative copper export protein